MCSAHENLLNLLHIYVCNEHAKSMTSHWLLNHPTHCWLGYLTHKIVPKMACNVGCQTLLYHTIPYHTIPFSRLLELIGRPSEVSKNTSRSSGMLECFTGWMPFLVPNQQYQSTSGTDLESGSVFFIYTSRLVR